LKPWDIPMLTAKEWQAIVDDLAQMAGVVIL
jgi:hypothetical protein